MYLVGNHSAATPQSAAASTSCTGSRQSKICEARKIAEVLSEGGQNPMVSVGLESPNCPALATEAERC